MAGYEIVITDVTCYGSLFCVAGWDLQAARMIRPEPPSANTTNEASRFWNGQIAGSGKLFAVGNIVRFSADPAPASFPFPHATEDRIMDLNKPRHVQRTLNPREIAAAAAPGVRPTLDDAFWQRPGTAAIR